MITLNGTRNTRGGTATPSTEASFDCNSITIPNNTYGKTPITTTTIAKTDSAASLPPCCTISAPHANSSPTPHRPQVSIIIPTYNESQNILRILRSIGEALPKKTAIETIVVDDNSPDGTGNIVEEYIENVKDFANQTINIIHRKAKTGLSSAILSGIQQAAGDTIVVMDSDMSHPANTIPKLLDALKTRCDLAIASRYISGGVIEGWNLKRKIISKTATQIAKNSLHIDVTDPMSGFFAFKKKIIKDLKFDAIGYKMLLEILVKNKDTTIAEIPYTFTNRQFGSSKLDSQTIFLYIKSVWRLYRYGKNADSQHNANQKEKERMGTKAQQKQRYDEGAYNSHHHPHHRPNPTPHHKSAKFLSKAARFFTVGASGLGINYLVSLLLAGGITDMWYLYANGIGIAVSMTTNFVLNKSWTFGDRDFKLKKTLAQYLKFVGFSSFGALVQIGLVYTLVSEQYLTYPAALVVAVAVSALGNFVLNKKWTFNEKIWD